MVNVKLAKWKLTDMAIGTEKLRQSVRKLFASKSGNRHEKERFEIIRTTEDWRRVLTPDQYYILREHGTERAGSSLLLKEDRFGTYHCAGCGEAVYASDTKFDSGTGWPSFTAPIGGNVKIATDRSMSAARTEVHCGKCGGHLGHRFADGPGPAGMRHCVNGGALTFASE